MVTCKGNKNLCSSLEDREDNDMQLDIEDKDEKETLERRTKYSKAKNRKTKVNKVPNEKHDTEKIDISTMEECMY